MEEKFRASVSNPQVAVDLGISESMVSRIRSGDRFPSVALMRKITEVYRWKPDRQMAVFGGPAYAYKFEQVLDHHYNREGVSA